MENGLQTTIIVSFFGFLFTGITGIAVFFLIRLIKTIDKLTDVVERMGNPFRQGRRGSFHGGGPLQDRPGP